MRIYDRKFVYIFLFLIILWPIFIIIERFLEFIEHFEKKTVNNKNAR